MSNTSVAEETSTEVVTKEPGKYRVIIHNDPVTTFEFVISLLGTVFHKSYEEAYEITLYVHEMGAGTAGIYTKEIAQEKTLEGLVMAKASGFPINITYEEY